MMRQTPQPTDPGSSEPVSETESGCESADPLAPETVRMLRLELEGERRQNKQLQAKLKRAAKLNEQLVRTAGQDQSLEPGAVGGGVLLAGLV